MLMHTIMKAQPEQQRQLQPAQEGAVPVQMTPAR